eukprot:g52373.t1
MVLYIRGFNHLSAVVIASLLTMNTSLKD